MALAKCEFREKEYEKAAGRLEGLLEGVAANARAAVLNELGMCYDKLKRPDDAFECFRESNEILRERQEDLEEMKEEGFRIISTSLTIFNAFIREDPDAGSAFCGRASAHLCDRFSPVRNDFARSDSR